MSLDERDEPGPARTSQYEPGQAKTGWTSPHEGVWARFTVGKLSLGSARNRALSGILDSALLQRGFVPWSYQG